MEALDLIFRRRSIRKFTDEPVSNAQIEILRRINHTLIFGKMKAPCAVSVCGDLRAGKRVEKFWIQDCSAATENLLLAATGLGLGAVWCGVTPIERYQKQIAEILLLPQGVIPLNVIFIGHPAEEKPPRTQYDPKNISHNAFGNPWQVN